MQIEVPDDIVRRAEISSLDLYAALALQLYADNCIDHADACRLSGMSAAGFNRELLRRALSVQEYPHRSATRLIRTAG
jgi:predicted HTH domain antitoxin